MNLIVKTKQVYEKEKEEQTEEIIEATVSWDEESVTIASPLYQIILHVSKQEISIHREKNNLEIKINEKKSLNYETLYGKMTLETYGEELHIQKSPFQVDFRYRVNLNSTEEYVCFVEIFER